MAKKLQLLRNSVVFDTKANALAGLKAKLVSAEPQLAAGEPLIASYTDGEGDKVSILLAISHGDGKNYQIFEGAKIGVDGNLEIPQEVKDAIKEAVNGVIGGASDGYNTLKKIEGLMKAQDTKISGLQTELDATQVGAGLETNGSYVHETGSYCIDDATSLKDADKKLDAAIKTVAGNATKVAAGNGIDVQTADHTATVSVKLNTSDKVLTVDGDGLLANLSLKYIKRVTEGEPAPAKLQLIGKGETVITELDVNDFVMDGMLANAELQGDKLVLTFNTDSGKSEIRVNLSKYIDVYTAGNGISVSGKVISVKRDVSSESFLSVAEGGVKLSGVQDAINAAKTTIDAYTVNTKVISTNPVLNGADIALTGYVKGSESTDITADDTINAAFGKVENKISTLDGNVLKQVVASDGISVTTKDANSQTISISENAVWDCGFYD